MRQLEAFYHYGVLLISLTADERHRWLCNLKLNSFNLMKTVQSVKAVVGRLDAEAQSYHISRPTPCPLLVRGHVRSSARAGRRPATALFLFVFAEGLQEYFSKFGEITECTVMKDPGTKRSRWDGHSLGAYSNRFSQFLVDFCSRREDTCCGSTITIYKFTTILMFHYILMHVTQYCETYDHNF